MLLAQVLWLWDFLLGWLLTANCLMTNCAPYCTVQCLKIVTRVDVSWNGIFWDRSNWILGRCLFFKTHCHISLRSFPVVHKIGNVGILVFGINLIPWVTKVAILLLDIYILCLRKISTKSLSAIIWQHFTHYLNGISKWKLVANFTCWDYENDILAFCFLAIRGIFSLLDIHIILIHF